VSVTDPTCDVATGSFIITSSTAGLTFSMDGGAFAAYPAGGYTGLNSGSHTLQVRNSEGCTNSVTVTIGSAPGAPDPPQVNVTDPTCDVATGSFTITSSTAGLTFSLNNGAFAAYPAGGYTGLNSGSHTLQVRNSEGCTNSVTVTIGSAPGAPDPPQVSVTDPTCDMATGSFIITSSTAGLTFSLNGGAFAAYPAGGYTGLNSGSHTLQVRNSEGCTNSVTITIGSAPGAPPTPVTQVTQPDCTTPTGSFVITSSTSGYTFSLDGNTFTEYPAQGYSGLAPGNHTLQIRNTEGCTNSVTVIINPTPPIPAEPVIDVTQPTIGVPTGSIVITSPTSGLVFSLNGGSFAPYPAGGYSGLSLGDYVLTVRNNDGCTNFTEFLIMAAPSSPGPPEVSIIHPDCDVATGSFIITSSTTGLTFKLNDESFAPYPAGGYKNLQPGDYILTAQSGNGAEVTVTININPAPQIPGEPTITATHPSCTTATGSFIINSSTAGLTFSLNGGAFTDYPATGYTGLNPGSHTLEVKNIDGCTNKVMVDINPAPGAPEVPLVNITNPTCDVATGSFIVSSSTTGLTFSLDGSNYATYPAGGYSGLNPGNYTLHVKNSDGCINSIDITIGSAPTTPGEPIIIVTQPDKVVQTGSFIITSPTSGLTFSLNSGAFTPYPASGYANLTEGKYILVVRNAEGCENSAEFSIMEAPSSPPEPTVDVIHPTCDIPTGSFTITSQTDELLFRINSGAFEPYPGAGYQNLQPGDYALSAMGSNGIMVTVNVTINPAPETPDEPSVIITQPSCEVPAGSFVITSSTNNLTFSFNGEPFAPYPAGGYTNVYPGNYSLVAKNPAGCTTAKEIILVAAPGVPDDFDICCNTPPIILKNLPDIFPQGGIFYWQGSAIEEFIPDCSKPGNHIITYRYVDLSTSMSRECTFTITVKPLPSVRNLTPVLCEDPASPGIATNINLPDYNTTISAQPNLTFTWFKDQNLTELVPDPGNTAVSNNLSYYVKVHDTQTGCHQTAIVTFRVSNNLGVTDMTVELCENTSTLKEYHNLQLTRYNQEVFAGSQGTVYSWFSDPGLNNPVTQTLLPIVRHNDIYYVEVTQGNCKNVASVTFDISDVTPPAMHCQPHTANLDSRGLVTITVWDVDNGSTDNCDITLYFLNDLNQKVTQLEFDCNDTGDNIVRLYGSDPSGNTAYCEALVTVNDIIPPVARCRPPFTIYLGPGGTYSLTPSDINNGSSDECGIVDEKLNRTFFTCADAGTHTIRLTVFDPSGNSDYCETQITIIGNLKPIAADDHEKVAVNQPKIMIPLLNDIDPGLYGGLNPLSISIITPPQHGTVTTNTLNGSVIYTPEKDYTGTDSFVYVICDNGIPCEVLCDSATVYIKVLPPNHPPMAFDKVFDVGCNGITSNILRGLPNIHDADYDPDGDDIYLSLPLISQPSYGTLNIGEDGSFFYIPNAGYVGLDFLEYEICDNGFPQMCVTARITFFVFEDADCDDIPDVPPVVLFIPEGFSPNGDDVHDYFRISGIDEYPDAKMVIFNRWGNKVFEKEKYGNLSHWGSDQEAWWWGISEARGVIGSGKRVPVGNYLYLLNLGNGKTITGTVMVSY
jgi:gliding motility-associated-like protein